MKADLYSKLSDTSKIGLKLPILKTIWVEGTNLPLALKPPKFPKNWDKSKKTYRDLFVRSLKKGCIHHIYSREGLYIVSVYKSTDEAYKWLDKRYDEIIKRKNEWMKEY